MLVFVTKASDDDWYDFKEVNTLDDLMKIHDRGVIVEENDFYNNPMEAEGFFDFWNGFKKEDISRIISAKYHIIIYDSYIE